MSPSNPQTTATRPRYRIELGFETACIEEYARWLEDQGHVVTHGGAAGQRIRGLADPEDESREVSALWDAYRATRDAKPS